MNIAKIETLKNRKNVYDEAVSDIRMTNDYSKFYNIIGNRKINDKNYSKLIHSMKNKQLMLPILVNEKFHIIDGQHRFQAIKELGLPVYYHMAKGYTLDEVKRANMVSCNWNIDDFLNLYVKLGNKPYIYFEDLLKEYKISTSFLIEVVAVFDCKPAKSLRFAFEDGSFEMQNRASIFRFLQDLQIFSAFKFSTHTPFAKAFLKLYNYDLYNHNYMKTKVEKYPHRVTKCSLYSNYLFSLVEEVYNFNNNNVTFKYDVANNNFYAIR